MESDAAVELLKDPVYAERLKHWFANPRELLDHRRTLARCQALADMMENRVRRLGLHGEIPPPLLYAIDQLRKMHLVVARLGQSVDETKYIHVDIVNSFVANTIAVLTEFAPPDRLGAALDKLYALQEAAVPGTREAQGRASHRYG